MRCDRDRRRFIGAFIRLSQAAISLRFSHCLQINCSYNDLTGKSRTETAMNERLGKRKRRRLDAALHLRERGLLTYGPRCCAEP
jgi:hypothetical protein